MSVVNLKLKSVYLNDIDEVTVILPDPPMRTEETPEMFYRSGKKYKVFWLLHGGRDTMRDFMTYSNVPRLAVKYGIIIVMPNGHDSDYVNHPESGDGYLFYDYFFKELMPCIYNWFPASEKREDNYLGGCSMGCAATWQYSLLHPEKFGCIAPLCNQPLDYRYLEDYREMDTLTFRRKAVEEGNIMAAYGAVGEKIHTKELNTICKYNTVGEFLDSIENPMQRFEEAVSENRVVPAWVPCGNEPRDFKLLKFKEYCENNNLTQMKFEVFENEETHSFPFWEKACELFLQYLGLQEVDYFVGA